MMGSTKKKDLEIIYNLQWKNKPTNGGDKANIIGMYDIPATTLNWEIFKSYLLKNSGIVGDDVKVSYITDSNREFPIESQTDFQIALYAFRRKARMGDIVNLKMDRISDQPTHKNNRHSNDVETQFDNETVSLNSTCCNVETPPEWFIVYMDQFKKTISDEITATVSSIVSNIKPHTTNQPSCYGRKGKSECPRQFKKLHPKLTGESPHDAKDLMKLKLEGKLERKLEKLEHKTKKIKEKKLALLTKSSDSDVGPSSSKNYPNFPPVNGDEVLHMDVTPVSTQSPRHMLGGEDILHQWVVLNSGSLPWSHKTSLKYTWGSKALKPMDSAIEIPYLIPGETGVITVRLQVPIYPGNYECYYHFHHEGRRFGHWLGCQVIVDPFYPSNSDKKFVIDNLFDSKKFKATDKDYDLGEAVTEYCEIVQDKNQDANVSQSYTFNIDGKYPEKENKSEERIEDDDTSVKNVLHKLVRDITVEDVKLQEPTDTNCSSDSDNQSISSLESLHSRVPTDFVIIPDCFKVDTIPDSSNVQNEDNASGNDIVTDSVINKEAPETSHQVLEENPEQVPDNYDDNNNTERINQNPSVSETAGKVDDDSSDGSQKSDIVIISLPKEDDEINAGYAYVIIDGHRMQIPKKILKSEYLMTAERSPSSNMTRTNSIASSVEMVKEEEVPQLEAVISEAQSVTPTPVTEPTTSSESNINVESNFELLSHCSAAGSTFSEFNSAAEQNSRLFIFPQNCPGYEVVYPVPEFPENTTSGVYKWSDADDRYIEVSDLEFYNIPSAPLQPTTSASSPPLNLSTHDRNPFTAATTDHVPNYQQTPPEMRSPPESTINHPGPAETATTVTAEPVVHTSTPEPKHTPTPETVRIPQNSAPIHILPETLVSGAVNVASSAINSARSIINMIVPHEQPGRWVNGHWISTNSETPREGNLQALAEMGFWNRDLNATLLARYNDDLSRVVAELVQ